MDATISTNAFSDLRCIDDSLPIVRFIDSKTVQCLSKDKTNCMLRGDLGVSVDTKCNDINTYLVKEIRNSTSPVRAVFNDLESNVNYNLLTCTPDGMSNKDHWCGKMYDTIQNKKCIGTDGKPTNDAKFGYLTEPCKKIPQYAISSKIGRDVDLIDSAAIANAKMQAKAKVNLSRGGR